MHSRFINLIRLTLAPWMVPLNWIDFNLPCTEEGQYFYIELSIYYNIPLLILGTSFLLVFYYLLIWQKKSSAFLYVLIMNIILWLGYFIYCTIFFLILWSSTWVAKLNNILLIVNIFIEFLLNFQFFKERHGVLELLPQS